MLNQQDPNAAGAGRGSTIGFGAAPRPPQPRRPMPSRTGQGGVNPRGPRPAPRPSPVQGPPPEWSQAVDAGLQSFRGTQQPQQDTVGRQVGAAGSLEPSSLTGFGQGMGLPSMPSPYGGFNPGRPDRMQPQINPSQGAFSSFGQGWGG